MKKKFSVAAVIAFLSTIIFMKFFILESPSSYYFMYKIPPSVTMPHSTIPSAAFPIQALRDHNHRSVYSGPADIFALSLCCNLSAQETEIVSIWRHFKPVMARRDLFSDAKDSKLEAHSAWKKLVEFVNETHNQKPPMAEAPKPPMAEAPTGDRQNFCPHSVSHLNHTNLSKTNAFLLQIPCGLVLDSSISLVGVPGGLTGDFKIDLIGGNQVDPPIILHFNIRLRGDRLTQAAVIVQNTWTAEDGWGEESRCPSKDGSKTVDGMEVCAQSIGKPIPGRNSSSMVFPGASSKHGMDSKQMLWFPFREHLPFAATLWVGWEGFHMTVDGKHMTSFEYQQSLEPWLVNAVKFAGDLQLSSVMAKGLPIMGDASILPDVGSLKAPSILSKHAHIKLFIGVISTANNFDRRSALRNSWMQYEAIRSGTVAVRFFIGLHTAEQVNVEVWKEAVLYGDIQLLPFTDYYSIITLKSISICIYATQNVKADFVMKTDDDTFVRVDEVLSRLNRARHSGTLLYGFISFKDTPHRDKSTKWYISDEEWPHPLYPPWAHGPGYIISANVAKFIVKMCSNPQLKLFKLEDVAMGIWIDEYKRRGHDVRYVHDEDFMIMGCKKGHVIAHYQTPAQLRCIWAQIQRGSGPVCCP